MCERGVQTLPSQGVFIPNTSVCLQTTPGCMLELNSVPHPPNTFSAYAEPIAVPDPVILVGQFILNELFLSFTLVYFLWKVMSFGLLMKEQFCMKIN